MSSIEQTLSIIKPDAVERNLVQEIKNIFLHDKGNNLKNLSTNSEETNETTITAENGI